MYYVCGSLMCRIPRSFGFRVREYLVENLMSYNIYYVTREHV